MLVNHDLDCQCKSSKRLAPVLTESNYTAFHKLNAASYYEAHRKSRNTCNVVSDLFDQPVLNACWNIVEIRDDSTIVIEGLTDKYSIRQ